MTATLDGVGLGDLPGWLMPHPVLSSGEKFRAARALCEKPGRVVMVVDRQIANLGVHAYRKAWDRTGGKCVLLREFLQIRYRTKVNVHSPDDGRWFNPSLREEKT